jgi:Arginyl-tRNA synthetase
MILAKKVKENSRDLADKIKKILLKDSSDFEEIEVAGPGFLNIKLSNSALKNIIEDINKNKNLYGSSKKNKKYNIEFVSANPTGPMHIGHCRGAIFGDVLSNLLQFNGNNVAKEYYINDCGSQIKNFTESVFLRLREIKNKEKFQNKKNLYPGKYIVDIANKILEEMPDINLKDFEKIYDLLKIKSLKHSMDLIKSDLKNLGIKHDNFFSESELAKKDSVNKTIKILKKNNFIEEGFLKPPKGEESKNWKKTKKLIFKSTLFGDDSDRSLQKDDGSWTYFANDLALHAE